VVVERQSEGDNADDELKGTPRDPTQNEREWDRTQATENRKGQTKRTEI
jgi:hypothetical protein